LSYTHKSLSNAVGNYFASLGFNVICYDAYIPKPLWAVQTFRLRPSARNLLLNQIDIIAFKSNCNLCRRACGLCEDDIIGIEVKPNLRYLNRGVLAQLEEYLCSCSILSYI